MKIYTVTVVNSESWGNGRESITIIDTNKAEVLKESWEWYENLNTEAISHIETDMLYKEDFVKELEKKGLTYIQFPDHHIQFEYFETEL